MVNTCITEAELVEFANTADGAPPLFIQHVRNQFTPARLFKVSLLSLRIFINFVRRGRTYLMCLHLVPQPHFHLDKIGSDQDMLACAAASRAIGTR